MSEPYIYYNKRKIYKIKAGWVVLPKEYRHCFWPDEYNIYPTREVARKGAKNRKGYRVVKLTGEY